ncbi:MAG TPA: hypothetical protein ENK53_06970 [Thiotrichales bacterium]|nr:hypothetical protein [Thiotrichales bacterium]
MHLRVVAVLLPAVLAACATPRTMTRQEMLDVTSRTYCGVTKEQVLKAAEDVLRLNDPRDVTIAWPDENTMLARHRWLVYFVLGVGSGQHVWQFRAGDPGDDGCLKAHVLVSDDSVTSTYGAFGMTSTGAYTVSPGTATIPGNVINQPAVYELFWAQVDYMLGKRNTWPTCKEWDERIAKNLTYGNTEPLCLFVNEQISPDDPRAAEILGG